jgi:radical SAM superfamily enzyme YgiQ (UPF0313 family)
VTLSAASTFKLAEVGPDIEFDPSRPTLALINANPFAEGIANLGCQMLTQWLQQHGINVDFGFADTMTRKRPLLSGLISPLSCDVIAVSVPFVETQHHVPRLLRAAGVAHYRTERKEEDPIVVMGGMDTINPMPLAPFFDAVVIGEGRAVIAELVRAVHEGRRRKESKHEILLKLAAMPHVYVPSLYKISYDALNSVTEFVPLEGAPEKIYAARPLDMVEHPIYTVWSTPRSCYKYDDYFSLMVSMGCHLKCPFCVVGLVQGAENGRAVNTSIDRVISLSEDRRGRYGTNLIKMLFASSFSEQTNIDPLSLKNLLGAMLDRNFEVRVGSLNIKQADTELLQMVKRAGQGRVTFAPETSESLRVSVGKAYSKDDKIIEMAEAAGKAGLGFDLYTMVGIPGEKPRHLRDLAQLINRTRQALSRDQILEVSINPSFTMAQTPYERLATVRPEVARSRFNYMRGLLDGEEGIEWITVMSDAMCYYQHILSTGGEELAPVLVALSETYRPTEDDWRTAIWEHVGDDNRYYRDRLDNEVLPYHHIVFNDHGKMLTKLKTHLRTASRA